MNALIDITVPVFGIIFTGYLAGRLGILREGAVSALNSFVYYFALPALLFLFTARAPITETLHGPFIAVYLSGTAIVLGIALIVGRLAYGYRPPTLNLHGLTAAFSNTAYLGIPLFVIAFGPEGTLPAIIASVLNNMVLIGGAVAAVEFSRSSRESRGESLRALVRSLVRNPLLMAPVLGLVFSAVGLPIPRPVGNYLDLMGAAASPAALFALGLSLHGVPLSAGAGETAWLVFVKLVLHPLIAWGLVTFVFPLEPMWAHSVILLSAMPVGALVFVVSQQYGVYARRASAAVIVSTAISVVSLSTLMMLFAGG